MSEQFKTAEPTLEDYWRGIILLGRNSATYKFALGKSLLELKPRSGQVISLQELAVPFARNISEHLKLTDKQGTNPRSRFLDSCRQFNSGEIKKDQLVEQTVQLGFQNVIDAFHNIRTGGELPKRFYEDIRASDGGIKITDEFEQLTSGFQMTNLPDEVEARWRLVETAWDLGISNNLVQVNYDPIESKLYANDSKTRRTNITSCRDGLNGYQLGHCFYCFKPIDITKGGEEVDVDHFFPHLLKQTDFPGVIDGVWNLVLSCTNCNRGPAGKFDRVPQLHLLDRLHMRNEFLISSAHPLRETLMMQTGDKPGTRASFLNRCYTAAKKKLLCDWEPNDVYPEKF